MGANLSNMKTTWTDLPHPLPDIRMLTWAHWDMILVKLAKRIVQFEYDLYSECKQIIEDMKNISDIAQCVKIPRRLHSMESLPRMITSEIEQSWTPDASRAKVSRLKKEIPFTPNVRVEPVYVGSYYLNNAKSIYGFWYAIESNLKCTLKHFVLKAQRDLREGIESSRYRLEPRSTFMLYFMANIYNYLDCKFKIYKRTITELNKILTRYQDDILSIMNAAVQERERKPYVVLWGDLIYWDKHGLPLARKENHPGIPTSGPSGLNATNPALRRENPYINSPPENDPSSAPNTISICRLQETSDNTHHILQTNVSGKDVYDRIRKELKIIVDLIFDEEECTIRKLNSYISTQRLKYTHSLQMEVAGPPRPYRRFHPYRRWTPPPSPLSRQHYD